jgi:hypothetical protein
LLLKGFCHICLVVKTNTDEMPELTAPSRLVALFSSYLWHLTLHSYLLSLKLLECLSSEQCSLKAFLGGKFNAKMEKIT